MLNKIFKKIYYLQRIFSAYLGPGSSQLSFWHGKPEVNPEADYNKIGQYYMPFLYKAKYQGSFDNYGIPLLNYRGKIGKQYNPIAIAQYGLSNYNVCKQAQNKKNLQTAIKQADWLVNNLEENKYGIGVWMHHFDWEYREGLKAPWYSALAQGQGISLLVRAFAETRNEKYLLTADKAFKSLVTKIEDGGVLFIDDKGDYWLEEYLVSPPSHVLNGFIWAIWGVYDYYLVRKDKIAHKLYLNCLNTIKKNLYRYDIGYWSLYDLSKNKMKTIASSFYHGLHIVQLRILYNLTGEKEYLRFANKWKRYKDNFFNCLAAFLYKAVFKLIYY